MTTRSIPRLVFKTALTLSTVGLLASASQAQQVPTDPGLLDPWILQVGGDQHDLDPQARERIRSFLESSKSPDKSRGGAEVTTALRQLARTQGSLPAAMLPGFAVDGGKLSVEVRLTPGAEKAGLAGLAGLEARPTARPGRLQVDLPIADLDQELARLAALPSVAAVQPLFSNVTSSGSVLSEGDAALGADQARAALGVDGSGVKVCVISDGIDSAASAVATGDLPDDGAGGPAVDVCSIEPGSGDEGTAMLEIIHDLAPGAALGFCGAGSGAQGIADAVTFLAGDGCDVVVDDVLNFTEPYFEDGVVAQAIDAAEAGGTIYLTAAGNQAEKHYEERYLDSDPLENDALFSNTHDFGVFAGGDSDDDWAGVIGSGAVLFFFLQWDESFGQAGNDFDLWIFDAAGFPAGHPSSRFAGFNGLEIQDGDDDPSEVAGIQNLSSVNELFFIVIEGPGRHANFQRLEMFFNDFPRGSFTVQFPEGQYNVPGGSIFGGRAAEGAITVAATGAVSNIDGTPNPGLDIIEPFSSQGPSIIVSPGTDYRLKPDLTAVDGTSVTGAGGFPSPFFGTSAAAPHAAAVAALVVEAAGGQVTPEDVRWILKVTTESRGDFDSWGFGLIDAVEAVDLASHFCW